MRMAIVVTEKQKDKIVPIVDEAKKLFASVLLVSMENTKLSITENNEIFIKKTPLSSFDCVLILPSAKNLEYSYIVAKMLEGKTYLPITAENIMLAYSKPILLAKLQDMRTKDSIIVGGTIKEAKNIRYPLVVEHHNTRIGVKDKETLNSVMSLFKWGTVVSLEKYDTTFESTWHFTIEGNIAGSYLKKGNTRKKIRPSTKAVKFCNALYNRLGFPFFDVNLLEGKTVKFNSLLLSPDFTLLQKTSGRSVVKELVAYIHRETKRVRLKSPIDAIIDDLKTWFSRWFK